MRVLVLGAGSIAKALGAAWAEAGFDVIGRRGRRPWQHREIEPPDAMVIAVRDQAIAEVAQAAVAAEVAGPQTVLVHAAGALPPDEVFVRVRPRVAGVALCHPLVAVARGEPADLHGALFAVVGDERGAALGQTLARAAGGRPVVLSAAALGRYHAAAVLVANHTLGLLHTAVTLLTDEGIPAADAERALAALLTSAADNVRHLGLRRALTGPIARGDHEVVARHLAALGPREQEIYRVTARPTVELARAKAQAAAAELDTIGALLDGNALKP